MEYNTTLEKLILPEYGRNIQKLVENATKIEDDKERKLFVEEIIRLMGQMYPYLKDLKDAEQKLWGHLVVMSDFKLSKDSPFPAPEKVGFVNSPEKIPYKSKNFRYKHFGKNIVDMLKYAVTMEEGEDKKLLTALIANHMKKLYLTWSKDMVTDEFIFEQIKELSDGKIEIGKDITLSESHHLVSKKKKTQQKRKRK